MGKIPFVRRAPLPSLINPLLNRLKHSGECGVLNLLSVVGEFREILSGDFTNLLVLQDAYNFCALGFCRINPAKKLTVNTPLCRHEKSLGTSASPGLVEGWIIIPLPFTVSDENQT